MEELASNVKSIRLQVLMGNIIQCKTVAGVNFGKFGESGAICQSFTHPNLYHKTAGINSMTNEYRANNREHAWLKLVATKSTWTLFNPRYSPITTVYASSSWMTRFSFTMKLCSVIGSIIFMSSRVLSPHYKCPHHFSTTHDDKVNDCGFKFNMACKWCVLFKEDKDDSLQFAKIFPTKFLVTNLPKFFPATILRYTVRYQIYVSGLNQENSMNNNNNMEKWVIPIMNHYCGT